MQQSAAAGSSGSALVSLGNPFINLINFFMIYYFLLFVVIPFILFFVDL